MRVTRAKNLLGAWRLESAVQHFDGWGRRQLAGSPTFPSPTIRTDTTLGP